MPSAATTTDTISVAGLQSLNLSSAADATVQATTTAASSAEASSVNDTSSGTSIVSFNEAISAASGGANNTIGSLGDGLISGIATTTALGSADSVLGAATASATVATTSGISDITSLTVGGELQALGKAIDSITATAGSVGAAATASSSLSGLQQGLEATSITAAAVSRWMVNPRSLRVLSVTKARQA